MVDNLNHSISIRVANLSYRLATFLDLPKAKKHSIYKSALFHDLGKLKIDSKILNKPGKLTRGEFEDIKKHSIFSYQIGLKLGLSKDEALNILYHHENFDGTGYPMGLKGSQIPLGARIIRITDVFDALVSDRSYKKKMSLFTAIEIMENEKKNFDNEIFNIFLENIRGDII